MNTIKVKYRDTILEVEKGSSLYDLSKKIRKDFKNHIILATLDNEYKDMRKVLEYDCTVDFFDLENSIAYKVYQNTVVFMFIYAIKKLYGNLAEVGIEYSIDKNIYCKVDKKIHVDNDVLKSVNKIMNELVENDTPIESIRVPISIAKDMRKKYTANKDKNILKYTNYKNIDLYSINGFYNYFYTAMPLTCGQVNKFEMDLYNNGFIIRFVNRKDPTKIKNLKELPKITRVFEESSEFVKIIGVNTVGVLNKEIAEGGFGELVRVSEALHEKKIVSIAHDIKKSEKKLVLIAGPSSSGKTTFSKKLGVQLRVQGLKPMIIGLDNYYVDIKNIPTDEKGERNFENIESLEIDLINEHLSKLLKGEEVELPTFDFKKGKKIYKGNKLKLEENSVMIIEGIHGLNEKLTSTIKKDNKFKIFISALTQLNLDSHNRIPTADTRLIRRITRDSKFRGFDPEVNFKMWPKVLEGEAKNIFPYQEEADAIFNSSLVYEFAVLKPHILPLLYKIERTSEFYPQARRIITFLEVFLPVNSDDVPMNSLLREFIGGSCFTEL